MRLVRTVLVRRLVAAVLVVSLGATLVPAAGAQGTALRTVLDDAAAVQLALDAARAADAGENPVVVFAEAYAAAVEGVTAEALIHLLGQPSMSGVLPPAADDARASAPMGPSPSASVATFVEPTAEPVAVAAELGVGPDGLPALRTATPSARPRAP